jgi:hypothetical protein
MCTAINHPSSPRTDLAAALTDVDINKTTKDATSTTDLPIAATMPGHHTDAQFSALATAGGFVISSASARGVITIFIDTTSTSTGEDAANSAAAAVLVSAASVAPTDLSTSASMAASGTTVHSAATNG